MMSGKTRLNSLLALVAASTAGYTATLWAQSSSDFESSPALLETASPPRVMLLLSNDQQLYYKAYTDYTDLDGDGTLDTEYNDAFDYYGYFDSDFCYDYSGGRFQPLGTVDGGGHTCTAGAGQGEWSGNFLNWASMTRMDIVRRVYYGGMRVVDSNTQTVLQRALIPNDAHAFVKTHSGSVADYTPYNYSTISMCNVTLGSGQTNALDVSTNPPLLRIANGDYPLWAGTEVLQCMTQGEYSGSGSENRPATVDADLNVRVQACVSGQDADSAYCRDYGTALNKPAGILQNNSEDGAIQFGLMTGTHEQKISGGILRRNITALAGNTDPNDDEVDLGTGRFRYMNTAFTGGIIQTLDSMRIAGWDYGNRRYNDCSTHSITISTFKANNSGNRSCRDWGNPIAEMYMEALRYFAANGNSPISQFSTGDDSSYLTGMGTEAWEDPLDGAEPCAKCSIIVMSTGLNSFDADNLDLVSGLPGISGLADIESRTDAVGTNEGLDTGFGIVGNSDGTNNSGACTSKALGSFSDILGICAELPSLEGSYNLAGLANYAQTTDMRPEAGLPDVQRINTYTIALAENLPSFLFETQDGSEIGIVPACQARPGSNPYTDCSIVNAKVIEKTPVYTRIDIAWEDSLWGNDYDLDGMATIEVCTATGSSAVSQCQYNGAVATSSLSNYQEWRTDAAASELQVRVSVPHAFAGNDLRFGVIVAGSLTDSTYYNADRPGSLGNYTCVQPGYCNSTAQSRMVWASPIKLTAGSSTAQFLENPLWYAAKYGNFDNSDRKTLPTDVAEWDTLDLNGDDNPDGIPDAYFPVRNPGQLALRLQTIINDIEKRAASGASVAVTLERRDGVGSTFQAYYFPSFSEGGENPREVTWVGGLHALFLDGDLNLREDTNGDAILDSGDVVINLVYNGENTVVQRLNPDGTVASTVPFYEIEPIWDARGWLTSLTDAQVVNQRNYTNTVGRHIFTWMDVVQSGDTDPNGVVDANEVVDFTPANVSAGLNHRILGVATAPEGDDIINYVRGSEIAGMRSRTLAFDGDGFDSVWRLADIVHSSPAIVGAPGDNYEVEYKDDTYQLFRDTYLNRRQVVYAGSNGGMLHAFNAGFYQQGTRSFLTSPVDSGGVATHTQYDLGAELWAYVPRNLLPHLRWMTENNYPHVFYVDGEPQVFDVNIFTPSATHPGGWGTILVVGFRFGGGQISLDLDNDTVDDFTSRSAYVILDITDPEVAPTLLAEITDAELGYTTGVPALVKGRLEDLDTGAFNAGEDAWYLVFGSGPAGTDAASRRNALVNGVSNQSAKLYIYDLVANDFVDTDGVTAGTQAALDTGVPNSFVGDPTAVDWDRDYLDDVVYFGLVEGTNPAAPSGSLNRLMFNMNYSVGSAPTLTLRTTPITTLLDPNQPFQGAPVTYRDLTAGREWVLAGTGRFMTTSDNATSYASRFYGVLEPIDANGVFTNATVAEAPLADTTTLAVLDDNRVYDYTTGNTPAVVSASGTTTNVDTFAELMQVARNAGGWFNELGPLVTGTSGGSPTFSAESRNYNGAVSISSGVGFVKYAPGSALCDPSGFSSLRFVDSRTGTASRNIFFEAIADTDSTLNFTGDSVELSAESEVREGAIAKLTIVRTDDGTAVVSTNDNAEINIDPVEDLAPLSKRQSWRELPIITD